MANRATKRARRANRARQVWDPATAAANAKPPRSPRVRDMTVREQVRIRDGFLCRYCSEPGSTLDHVVPKCRGGRNTLENLVWCCRRCNHLKADLELDTFLVLLAATLARATVAPPVSA